MAESALQELMRATKAFSELTHSELELLTARMKRLEIPEGGALCAEGEEGDCMYIIEAGKVAVLKHDETGEHIEVAELSTGDVAGEMSLFGHAPRSADLTAKSTVIAWTLAHDDLDWAIQAHPGIAKGMLAALSGHLHRGTSMLAKLLSQEIDRRFKVAVFDSKPYIERATKLANTYNYALRFYEVKLTPETVALAAGCDAVCVFVNDDVDAEVVEHLALMDIRLVALRCAGYNNVDLAACAKHGVSVVRVPAYSPYAVAEHAVALMMTLNRKVHRANNRVREGDFSLTGLVGFDMHGRTAGIVGAGKIGVCTMRILKGFGCRVLVHSRSVKQELIDELGVEFVPLDQLLAESDVISLHAPLSPETRHLIDADAIAKMKKGVMLINTSRGALVDSHALLDGLKNGTVGYAGLDVYEKESAYFFEDFSDEVMKDDILARLTTFNNVIVTSHQGFLTTDALGNIAGTTLENIRAYQLGSRFADLPNAVNPG